MDLSDRTTITLGNISFSQFSITKGYNLPEGCDPLGQNPECGTYTGTGDWIVYYKWKANRCDDTLVDEDFSDESSDAYEKWLTFHQEYCSATETPTSTSGSTSDSTGAPTSTSGSTTG